MHGLSARAVASIEGVSVRHVRGILSRWQHQDHGTSRPGRGRHHCLTERDKRALLRAIEPHPFIQMAQLAREACPGVSRTTVRTYLKRWGIKHSRASIRPFLTEENAAERLRWAQAHLDKPVAYWRRVLWTDETIIERGISEQRGWVFRPTSMLFLTPVTASDPDDL
jgi:transposase